MKWWQVIAIALTVACSSTVDRKAEFSRTGAQSPSDRKIIRSGELTVTVPLPPSRSVELERVVTAAGGFVESKHSAESSVSLVSRVPAERLDSLMDSIAALGSVESRSVSAADVTEQHADLSTRLANNLALRDRLKALLDRAQDVEDVLAIEKELTRIQSEIETQQPASSVSTRRSRCPSSASHCGAGRSSARSATPHTACGGGSRSCS